MPFEVVDPYASNNAVIKVIGIGGGGGNAINHMIENGMVDVDFICVNTDAQALKNTNAKTVLQLGGELTKGLGAGADPEIGREAALEDRNHIEEILEGTDMVFLTSGMGGGTGTGATPVIAEIAKEMGILTVAIVTRPFSFEGKKRQKIGEDGIKLLSEYADSVITIPNEKLLPVLGRDVSLIKAFNAANDVLLGSVQGIADLITNPGLINVDFADVKAVMGEMGRAMMGTGNASGDHRAREAAEKAIGSPLLDDVDVKGAHGVLVNVTSSGDLSIGEFNDVGDMVRGFASDDATVIIGTAISPELSGEVRVTVVATGLERDGVAAGEPNLQVIHRKNDGAVDYGALERPTVLRNKPEQASKRHRDMPKELDLEMLDIPAFLRQQAD
ncbi:MAG: cell division protein FtsZ [Methylococcales bacterium]